MRINPYLHFNGNCEAAFTFYAATLNGKIAAMMPHEGTPMADQAPPEWAKKILHAQIEFGGTVLMGADAPPRHYTAPQGFSVSINLSDVSEAERIFAALAEDGKVQMPLQETFWAARFGMLTDRFNIPWMVNCEPAE